MTEPVFLTLAEALDIHQAQMERYGGSSGIRDIGLLESAMAMPQASFGGEYLHANLYTIYDSKGSLYGAMIKIGSRQMTKKELAVLLKKLAGNSK